MDLVADDHRAKVPFSSYHLSHTVHAVNMAYTVDVDLDDLAEIVLVRLLHCTVHHTVYSSSLLFIPYSLEESHYCICIFVLQCECKDVLP